jgi:hypothetical protein
MLIAPQPLPISPQHIIIDSTPVTSPWPLYISLASLIIAMISILFTFLKQASDRRVSWFHKVAVDPVLEQVIAFFEEQKEALLETSILYKQASSKRKTVSPEVTKTISKFTERLVETFSLVANRVEVFDPKSAESLRELRDEHQEKVVSALFRSDKDVELALLNAKRALFNVLRKVDH